MQKITVTSEEIYNALLDVKREVSQDLVYKSRCSEAKYIDRVDLPPLVLPGGNIGDLAIIIAAANVYGFKLDKEKVWKVIQSYQDDFGKKDLSNSCLHLNELFLAPATFHLTKEDITYLDSLIPHKVPELNSDHINGAVVFLKGMFTIPPELRIITESGKKKIMPFIFHYTLVNHRHRLFAQRLIKDNIVELFPGQDEEYLYEVISDMTDTHVFESIARLAPTLPLYMVTFHDNGNFEVEDLSGVLTSSTED